MTRFVARTRAAAGDFHFRWYSARLWPERMTYHLRARARLRRYSVLDEQALRASRRSETVFVFGSGYSINDLTAAEVADFEQHDTFGFNWFVHQHLVRADYHLVREIPENDRDPAIWRPQIRRYFELAASSPHYRDTIFLMQTGPWALNSNRALALGLVPRRNRLFLWRSVTGRAELSRSFARGLSHPNGTLEDCVNFAAVAGWKRIVLVGVDLYDRRYFWLRPDETRSSDRTRGASHADPHQRAGSGLIATLGAWSRQLRSEGVELLVYNPRSLLAGVLPVYSRPRA